MTRKPQFGFSLLETLVALAILVIVTGIVMSGMGQMMNTQTTIGNRTEMHAGVRSATELLQQEIGQAGKVSLGAPGTNVTLASGVAALSAQPLSFNTTVTVYPTEVLTVGVGTFQEVVTVDATSTSLAPTAPFVYAHPAGTPVAALGAFSTGIVPPLAAPASYPNGSTGTVLKLYGDINADGNMLYVEYTCQQGTPTNPGVLYRNEVFITAASKPAVDNTMILLNNVLSNPNDPSNNPVPCFNYQVQQTPSGDYVVTDVAVTLTVQPQNKDPQTGALVPETKALLNISPRNVVEVFDTAKLVDPLRAQPMPPNVTTNLLP